MEVFNENGYDFNITEEQKLLLEAMLRGDKIKSVTCMSGTVNKDKPELDFWIEGFVADLYFVRSGYNEESGWVDLVDVEEWTATTGRIHENNNQKTIHQFLYELGSFF